MNTTVTFELDQDLKTAAEVLFDELGMDLNTAFRIFIKQSLRDGGIPFWINEGTFNRETLEALEETDRIAKDPNAKRYSNLDEFFADLNSDCEKEQ